MGLCDEETAQLRIFPGDGFALDELPTPCLLLDEDRLERNLTRMADHWKDSGIALRPHLKTCRSWPVAKAAMSSPEGPACVAVMGEAEACAELGVRDITLAVGIRPALFERARALMIQGVSLKVLLDSAAMARALVEDAQSHGCRFSVLLEVDCDGHRAGLAPQDPRLVQIAALLCEGGQEVAGVLTHAGSAYENKSLSELKDLARREARAAGMAADLLRRHGNACPMVSVGATPTALLGSPSEAVQCGVTEVRAGVYMFMDLVMEGLGVCSLDDMALSVLTSVIGGFPEDGRVPSRLVTDAGWAALSTDRGLSSCFAAQGYGLVSDMDGKVLSGVTVADLNQEHGMLSVSADIPEETRQALLKLNASARLRVLPNHACAAAMMHKAYFVTRGGRARAAARRFGGW